MQLSRRRILFCAPAVILTPGLLMPVKSILGIKPREFVLELPLPAPYLDRLVSMYGIDRAIHETDSELKARYIAFILTPTQRNY